MGQNRYKLFDSWLYKMLKAIVFAVMLILILIIVFVFKEGLPFLGSEFVSTIPSMSWRPLAKQPNFGLLPMVLGTLYVGFLASFFALPLALGSAIYTTCCLRGKARFLFCGIVDVLGGIPSVVYGLLGFYSLVRFMEKIELLTTGESIFAAAATLAIMILPYMLSSYVRAFAEINSIYHLPTQALGVSDWYAMTHLILVQAKEHLITGYLLALSKALGETMAVMMVVGNSPIMPRFLGKGITLSGLIALEIGSAQLGSYHYYSLYTAGMILLLVLLIINCVVRKVERRMQAK